MGACCSKHSECKTISSPNSDKSSSTSSSLHQQSRGKWNNRRLDEEDDSVKIGDFGASVRVTGSSTYVSMDTQQGQKLLNINQDAITVWEDFTGDEEVIFCGVFDGHGPDGHNISRKIRDNLPSKLANTYINQQRCAAILQQSSDDEGSSHGMYSPIGGRFCENPVFDQWKSSIVRAFKEMDKDLHYDPVMDTYSSGATGITVVKQGDDLMVANLGDSRAVLCTRGERGVMTPIQLTVDLKPSLPREAERIAYCSGRVFALDSEPEVLRVWQAEKDAPGLSMSRAFGDFCLKDYGLISIPQLFYRKITEWDEFVVIASDGVWNVLSNLEVVRIVSSAKSRSMAAKLLVACAARAWENRHPKTKVDDISVICMFFKPPPASKPVRCLSTPAFTATSRIGSSSGYSIGSSSSGYSRLGSYDRLSYSPANRKISRDENELEDEEEMEDGEEKPKLKSILKTGGGRSPTLSRQRGRKVRFQENVEIRTVEE